MKRVLFLIMTILLFFEFTLADGTGGKTELGLNFGVNRYWGDIKDSKIGQTAFLSLLWWTSDYFALGFRGGASFVEAEKDNLYFKTMLYNFVPTMKLRFFPASPVAPYFHGGFEILHMDPRRKDGNIKLANNEAGRYNNVQFAIPFGGGLTIFASETVAFQIDASYHYCLTDYLDDIKEGDMNDGYYTLTLGLDLYFGKPKDTDKDGIPDKMDADPMRPEDYDAFQDRDGAPDYDNDQDGILDVNDQAPNDPEDRDGFMDGDGIPDLDNDKDGIKDEDDKCPGTDDDVAAENITKEDFDGYQDDDGCPDLDNDGDGLNDTDDNCPNEAETFNDYEDEDGCPDKKPEIQVEKGEAIILEGVTFATGSANLTLDSRTILDKVVRTMKEHTEIEVEIRGYTDNTGSYQGNVKLSKRRAESVRDYLVNNGIVFYRIGTKGFGPEDPIAPNNTRDGRAKNRRIEFFRVK
jgi:outer membrane protein OmpA-like peptidoglycan-associated protein